MNCELIITVFPREEDAVKALSALETMRDRQTFGLEGVVLMSRDDAGRAAIQQRWEPPTHPGSRLPRVVADALLSGSPHGEVQSLADAGLDELFLGEVEKELGPDSSALLIYVPQSGLVDTDRLLKSLALLRGTTYHTAFSQRVEEATLRLGSVEQQ
jgi:uncharacterized membrane protein